MAPKRCDNTNLHFHANIWRLAVAAQQEMIWCVCQVNWIISYQCCCSCLLTWINYLLQKMIFTSQNFRLRKTFKYTTWRINVEQFYTHNGEGCASKGQQMFLCCSSVHEPFLQDCTSQSCKCSAMNRTCWGVGCKKQGVASLLAWQQRYCFEPPLPETVWR